MWLAGIKPVSRTQLISVSLSTCGLYVCLWCMVFVFVLYVRLSVCVCVCVCACVCRCLCTSVDEDISLSAVVKHLTSEKQDNETAGRHNDGAVSIRLVDMSAIKQTPHSYSAYLTPAQINNKQLTSVTSDCHISKPYVMQ